MKDNTFNYSDDFQPYLGYDKFEYDILLNTGEIIENCYPNAGKFTSLNGEEFSYPEELVTDIRFSNNPVTDLNWEVSECSIKRQNLEIESTPYVYALHNNINSAYFESLQKLDSHLNPPTKRPKYLTNNPAKLNEQGRNTPCSCGSGLKYKNVMGNKTTITGWGLVLIVFILSILCPLFSFGQSKVIVDASGNVKEEKIQFTTEQALIDYYHLQSTPNVFTDYKGRQFKIYLSPRGTKVYIHKTKAGLCVKTSVPKIQ